MPVCPHSLEQASGLVLAKTQDYSFWLLKLSIFLAAAPGSTDRDLHVYSISAAEATATRPLASPPPATQPATPTDEAVGGAAGPSGRAPLLVHMGNVRRQAAGHDRVASIQFDAQGSMLACQGAGKSLELFR